MDIDPKEIAKLLEAESKRVGNGTTTGDERSIFGLQVSPQVGSMLNVVHSYFQPKIRNGLLEGPIRAYGMKMLGRSERGAMAVELAANAAGWGYTFAEPLQGGYTTFKNYQDDRAAVVKKMAPVMRAEGADPSFNSLKAGSLAGNEIVAVEKHRIHSDVSYGFKKNVLAETFAVLPQAIIKSRDDVARLGKTNVDGLKVAASATADDVAKKRVEASERLESFYEEQYSPKKFARLAESGELDRMIESDMRGGVKDAVAKGGEFLSNDMLREVGPAAGGMVTELVKDSVRKKQKLHPLKDTALDKIDKLFKVALRDGDVSRVDGKSLSVFVEDIFQLHQENMGQEHLGKRWQAELTYASKEIASAIEHGEMHPMALVHLVGERMIIKEGGNGVASQAQVREAIADMKDRMPAKFEVDVDKYYTEATFDKMELSSMLSELEGTSKDFMVALLPDDVLLDIGMTDAAIKTHRDNIRPQMDRLLADAALDVASKTDDELKANKMTDEEIKLLREVAKDAKAGDLEAVTAAVSMHGDFEKGIDWILVNMMSDGDYWQNIANKTREIGALKSKGEAAEVATSQHDQPAKHSAHKIAEKLNNLADVVSNDDQPLSAVNDPEYHGRSHESGHAVQH